MLLDTSRSVAPEHTSSRYQGAGTTVCAPPSRFRGAEGVRHAWPSGVGPFGRAPSLRGKSAAQKIGIRYERKVLTALAAEYGSTFLPNFWFQFQTGDARRWCQLDGIVREGDSVLLFEVKARFTSDAWWQLRRLYEPVVRKAWYPQRIRHVVVCKSFDPSTPFPEEYELISSLSGIQDGVINVLPWRRP